MRGRVVATAVLLAAGAVTPWVAFGSGTAEETFPPLPPGDTAAHSIRGGSESARKVERRARQIETAALGRDHAIEHAQGRYDVGRIQREMAAAHAEDPTIGEFSTVLRPKNDLVPRQVGGEWQAGQPLPIVAINAVQLHTGKILYFSYPWRATEPDPVTDQYGSIGNWNYADAYLYDPATGQSKAVLPPKDPFTGRRVELFCAGQSMLADGRVLITGGNVGDPAGDANSENFGLNTTYVFDPVKAERGEEPWTTGPRMRQGRWYPTQVLMPNGATVITSGQANAGGSRDSKGNLTIDQDAHLVNRDVEVYYPDGEAGTVERLSASRLDGGSGGTYRPDNVGQYPHMFWLPSGRILNFGPFKPDSWSMQPPKPGAASTGFTELPALSPTHREWASGFQVPGGPQGSSKVMLVGGADRTDLDGPEEAGALGTTTFFDEAKPEEGWKAGPTLRVARAFANSVLLPTGKVAVVGGGRGNFNDNRYYRWTDTSDQRRVEILDPQDPTSTPVLGNAAAEGRTYHSTALLLPDGRVWTAGDDINGPLGNPTPDHRNGGAIFADAQQRGAGSGVKTDTAEIWSPPYLFDANGNPAARPLISAGAKVGWGRPFQIRASADVTKAVLVAPGATTHANDMSQRLVTLGAPTRDEDVLTFDAPSTRDVAPPGWYMLFGLNDAGTPSVASWVYLGTETSPVPDRPPAPAPPGGTQPDPVPEPPKDDTTKQTKRLKVGVRLSVASTLARLRSGKRMSAVVTVDRAATVRVAAGVEATRRVKVKGRRKAVRRTVSLPLAKAKKTTFKRAGARRVRIRFSGAGVRRLRARDTATLRIVVTAKPRSGKAVRITRRPVLR